MSFNIVIPTGKRLGLPATLLAEDFEAPVVSGYQTGTKPTGWLLSNVGFGASRIGLNNVDSGDWVSPDPAVTQGMDPNYTNSGACTDVGEVGTIDINNKRYKLTTTIAYDKSISQPFGSPSGAYKVMLCALEGGFPRQTWNTEPGSFAARALITLSGSVADDGLLHTFTGYYTTDPVTDLAKAGYDLAVGIDGATSHAIVTSVKVEIAP